jgi:hypothetical protein
MKQVIVVLAIFLAFASRSAAFEHGIAQADRTRVHTSLSIPEEIRIASPVRCLLGDGAILHSPRGAAVPTGESAAGLFKQGGIRFQENRGQIADAEGRVRNDILFAAKAPGAQLYFRNDGISYVFTDAVDRAGETKPGDAGPMSVESAEPMQTRSWRMDMFLAGCNPAASIRAEGELPGYSNFYLPHCPNGIAGVKEYSRIVYEDVYDNVDLELFSVNGRMKYNFVVRPGGRPGDIRMRYEGAQASSLTREGALSVATPLGALEEAAPYTFAGDEENEVASRFVRKANTVAFDVADYDQNETLVIDPWATYCGGSGDDAAFDVAADATGNVYITGRTGSANIPASAGAFQTSNAGGDDAFVAKFNSSGQRVWATYYGGSDYDLARGVAVDLNGNVNICGETGSKNFPVSPGAFQTTMTKGGSIFVAQLNGSGARNWATFFSSGTCWSVAADGSGNVVFTGWTSSKDFPVTQGAFQNKKNTANYPDAILVKLSSTGSRLWATYYGGNAYDQSYSVTTDAQNDIVLTGTTNSTNFPVTAGAFQTSIGGFYDGFIVKFSSAGARAWATYYGGTGGEDFRSVATDGISNIYIGGTGSTGFPVTPGVFQTTLANAQDAVAIKFTTTGSRVWATYCGGSYSDIAYGIAVDAAGNAIITGSTPSADYPVYNALQGTKNGGPDVFITKFNSTASALIWSTFYGGTLGDNSQGIAVDGSGNVVIAGYTNSADFPTYNPWQASYGGGSNDAFIVQLNSNGLFAKQPATGMQAPTSIVLDQNYPNPFNPATSITYGISLDGHVRLLVYDIHGRLVAEPVNEEQNAGTHIASFDGAGLPGGVYLYRLEANGWVRTRLMTLLK